MAVTLLLHSQLGTMPPTAESPFERLIVRLTARDLCAPTRLGGAARPSPAEPVAVEFQLV